jgi:hypothetical protein
MATGAPNEHGVAIRMPSQSLLCADSYDANVFDNQGFRTGINTPANIQINKQQPLLAGYMTRLSLTEVNICWNTPNVNNLNRTLTMNIWTAAGVDCGLYKIRIPTAWYGGLDFAQQLQNILRTVNVSDGTTAEFLNWSVAWSDERDRNNPMSFLIDCNIGATSGNAYRWRIMPFNQNYRVQLLAPTVGGTGRLFPLTDVPSPGQELDDLTFFMGMVATESGSAPYQRYIRGGQATLQYTPYIDICSNILTKNQEVQDGDTSLNFYTKNRSKLARVYLSRSDMNPLADNDYATYTPPALPNVNNISESVVGIRPFTFHREFVSPKQIMWNTTENVDVIDLEVLDWRGNPLFITPLRTDLATFGVPLLILGNIANFQFTIQASET